MSDGATVLAAPTFSERIARRRELWWKRPRDWRRWHAYRDALHTWRERTSIRDRHDPDATWRCCDLWQRTLLNKWNSREFAHRHGCPVPRLYWRGRAPSTRLLGSLPKWHVVRPVWGTSRRGVLVIADGRDLLRAESLSPAEERRSILRSQRIGRPFPVLIEEFARPEGGEDGLPAEYKCHTFGDTIAAVEVIDRTGVVEGKHRYYTPDWTPFSDPMNTMLPQAERRDPPRCLDEMLRFAARLGTAFGTYARIDFFASDRGCLFNEFSSTPLRPFTAYCDELFGALWAEKFPDAT